jgi:hypothetical protein
MRLSSTDLLATFGNSMREPAKAPQPELHFCDFAQSFNYSHQKIPLPTISWPPWSACSHCWWGGIKRSIINRIVAFVFPFLFVLWLQKPIYWSESRFSKRNFTEDKDDH